MINNLKPKARAYFALALFSVVISSCTTSKRLKYFQDLPDVPGKTTEMGTVHFTESVIQPNDILNINVNTSELDAGQPINAHNGVNLSAGINNQTGASGTGTGYLIDADGNVGVPILGKLHLGGLTLIQAKDVIQKAAEKSFKDPVVDVRYSNFKITVLGEVNRPATYIMPSPQVSILDAIGYAGDLTIYGRRENVFLIRRDPTGKTTTTQIDLTQKSLLTSPYFYLHQNDVVYVEPRHSRQDNDLQNNILRYITTAAAVITAAVLVNRYGL